MKICALVALIAIASGVMAAPAVAEDVPSPAGRFQLAPGENSSFVRLDTRTGAVSHCSPDKDVWHCEPILDSGLSDRLTTLSGKVDRLSADVGRLSARVDALAARTAAPAGSAVDDHGAATSQDFAQTVVDRLLEMIRTLKHGRADQT